jgi:hypothetical protein
MENRTSERCPEVDAIHPRRSSRKEGRSFLGTFRRREEIQLEMVLRMRVCIEKPPVK